MGEENDRMPWYKLRVVREVSIKQSGTLFVFATDEEGAQEQFCTLEDKDFNAQTRPEVFENRQHSEWDADGSWEEVDGIDIPDEIIATVVDRLMEKGE